MDYINPKDILLYDNKSNPVLVYDNSPVTSPKANLWFSPYGYGNVGKYKPFWNFTLRDTEDSLSQYDRQMLVAISRQLFAQMSEVDAAATQKGNLTIGLGMDPIYNGSNAEWGTTVTKWLKNSFYNNCSPMGYAFDWRSVWKLVSRLVDQDGDLLMVKTADRNGFPQIDFVLTHRIGSRLGQGEVEKGLFRGYPIKDGVVYNYKDTPCGYMIRGTTPDDDYVVSTNNALLIYNPVAFDKGRGKPILSAAMKDGLNLQDIDDYINQMLKVESKVFLTETNETGQAPINRVRNLLAQQYGATNQSSDPAINGTATEPVTEYTRGGIHYIKNNGAKIESLRSNRPASETQDYITRIEKRMLACMEWPHQFLLSPETVGGAAARGIKELMVRSIQSRQQLIEKYALVALRYAVARGMTLGIIPEYYGDDVYDWSFSKAAELVLDAGYERAADINDINAGLKSMDEVVSKTGKRYVDVLNQRDKEARELLGRVEQLQKDYPQFASVALQLLQNIKSQVPIPISEAPATTPPKE